MFQIMSYFNYSSLVNHAYFHDIGNITADIPVKKVLQIIIFKQEKNLQ